MEKTENIFGEKIRELREEKGLSQSKLAKELGMDKQRISKYELGQRQADDQTKIIFADFFNVTIDYLLGRTDKHTPTVLPKQINPEILKLLEEIERLPPEGQERIKFAVKLLGNENEQSATKSS